ncbi:hypothetical protein [Caldisalinibacter kiritimatiensis]|uniref:hypothetical protein n=1 Tax=Caldisalinibacter kiritimatiensis TaxID=1304284 RepID=UPI0012DD7AA0|nr:hypothetical protein [Caldisalinibacter kiritimatiensis]
MSKYIDHLINQSIKGDKKAKQELLIRLKPVILSSIKKYYNRRECICQVKNPPEFN